MALLARKALEEMRVLGQPVSSTATLEGVV